LSSENTQQHCISDPNKQRYKSAPALSEKNWHVVKYLDVPGIATESPRTVSDAAALRTQHAKDSYMVLFNEGETAQASGRAGGYRANSICTLSTRQGS
jgi:hypothetical protein